MHEHKLLVQALFITGYFEWRKKTRKLSRHHRQKHDKLDAWLCIYTYISDNVKTNIFIRSLIVYMCSFMILLRMGSVFRTGRCL